MNSGAAVNADRPERPLWEGDYIRWWGRADWEWIACVNCGRRLTGPKAVRQGFGRECAAEVTAEMLESAKRKEHAVCRQALEIHDRAQNQQSARWMRQSHLKRQMLARRRAG